jgi:hypothetical protein
MEIDPYIIIVVGAKDEVCEVDMLFVLRGDKQIWVSSICNLNGTFLLLYDYYL